MTLCQVAATAQLQDMRLHPSKSGCAFVRSLGYPSLSGFCVSALREERQHQLEAARERVLTLLLVNFMAWGLRSGTKDSSGATAGASCVDTEADDSPSLTQNAQASDSRVTWPCTSPECRVRRCYTRRDAEGWEMSGANMQ